MIGKLSQRPFLAVRADLEMLNEEEGLKAYPMCSIHKVMCHGQLLC